ncbi:DUF4437 domain-containing protein [Agarivorans sp. 2_MG-2023]|uniref:DUF4437 domain-containing protein n=1 Tax=Agarivorans sp. 2_MG-2023 TaxID=3062647 RepID=UPI0026E14C07|nr:MULTISPECIES: DUF4437 domain-containing protein [unclassified Agarivorans]MDO6684627.1 DUF4437 domain-containing protein [Agarivorans sp. 3_MG-2023]MDO6714792.1 DUF4437 domain-containing protein [Agarivorans sp. 2_MG-2023]
MADDHTVISTDNINWGMLNPARGEASPKAADLWGDRTKDMATGMLVKFQKGFSSPPHIHNITYRGVVIEGLMHNDDPSAEKMWLPSGSFWIQPAGESHITAANGEENLIYLEIDSGPYLVEPEDHAFDNGERPINMAEKNIFWLNVNDATWLESGNAQISYLWGAPETANGSFVKLPAGFSGSIESDKDLKAVVVKGSASYQWNNQPATTALSPSSFFSSEVKGKHLIEADTEVVLYVKSTGRFTVK